MYNLLENQRLLDYVKNIISPNMFDDTTSKGEIIIFCPFCGDEFRKQNPDHGHCYLSINNPVFYCFRCDTKGTILKLLQSFDCKDDEILSYVKQYVKHNFIKNYVSRKFIKRYDNIIEHVRHENLNFDKTKYIEFKNYLKKRIGEIDFLKFLISPTIISNDIGCKFYNYDGTLSTVRLINNKKYNNHKNDYYFKSIYDYNIKHVVITEGPFDAIGLYLYSSEFPKDKTLYYSICGKNYESKIESLLINRFIIGTYTFNIIFDNDNKNILKTKRIITNLISKSTDTIECRFYKPTYGNDTGECQELELI